MMVTGDVVNNTVGLDLSNDVTGLGTSGRSRLHVFARKARKHAVKQAQGGGPCLLKTKVKDSNVQSATKMATGFSSANNPNATTKQLRRAKAARRASHDAALAAFQQDMASRSQFHAIPTLSIHVGVAWSQGTRDYMEDKHVVTHHLFPTCALVAIFDGHNGTWAAEFAAAHISPLLASNEHLQQLAHQQNPLEPPDIDAIYAILQAAFLALDDDILAYTIEHDRRDGATAVVVLVMNGMVFVANAGDSRAILVVCRGDPSTSLLSHDVERLSVDHKPNLPAEKARVLAAGGDVVFSGCWRVTHPKASVRLAVTRSLGDHPLKGTSAKDKTPALVSAVPSIRHFTRRHGDTVVVASDGLWDRVTDEEAMQQVVDNENISGHCEDRTAAALVEMALVRRTCDNVTVAVLTL
ncbi:hypothetical protein DYB38_005663 [Aphanomyces astaci]|uniref:PPM-type phosphatase domain-containing protein n=1 Tax=Aphanomyces astaci TaxID=112090 RepID=A0A397DL18_APHAT|nr:hypothetical protein DYB38_005663 [Aphanomyces astaci]